VTNRRKTIVTTFDWRIIRGELGVEVREDLGLTVAREDWSRVRSPARARRRTRLGYPQNVRTILVPDPNFYRHGSVVVGHPETIRRLREQLARKIDKMAAREMLG
jgi:hypothetical protein